MTNSKTAKLDVRMTTAERAALEASAALHGRSLGAEVRAALAEWLDRDGCCEA